jgi:hypothetical protein
VTTESNTTVEIDCEDVEFTPAGGVVFYGTFAFDTRNGAEAPRRPTIAFAAGHWRHAYAAYSFQAGPVAVQFWPGYVG